MSDFPLVDLFGNETPAPRRRDLIAVGDSEISHRVFSSGGGQQSIAALVLSAQGKIDFPIHLWSNVGDDSEDPETLSYMEDHAKPFADAHGITLLELRRSYADGRPYRTIYEAEVDESRPWFNIPYRGADGNPLKRQCTDSWKIEVVGRWLKRNGASKDRPAIVGIGFSSDELDRIKTPAGFVDPRNPEQVKAYPLFDLGLTRDDCRRVVAEAGLPVPPKSSCFFCPFHSAGTWVELKRKRPVLFDRAVEMEQIANRKLVQRGRGDRPVFLTRYGRPVDELVEDLENQGELFDYEGPEGCDTGYCWT